jgi:hypothetical protein
MTRRLAVARGWPLARAYVQARESGAPGALVGPADRLQALRLVLSRDPQAIAAFDRFVEAAEIPRPAVPTPSLIARSFSPHPRRPVMRGAPRVVLPGLRT